MKLFLAVLLVAVACVGVFAEEAPDTHAHDPEDHLHHDVHENKDETEKADDFLHHVIHEEVPRHPHVEEQRNRLIHDLFQNYDKRSYPTNSTLRLGFSLIRFDVDEVHNGIDVDGWLRESWADPRLVWKPEEYGGETILRIPKDQVWKPDTTLYNSALSRDSHGCHDTNVIIQNTGDVLWVPPCQFKAYCNLTLDEHPFGDQKCALRFGSWTYDGDLLDLQFYKEDQTSDLSHYWDNSDYAVTAAHGVRVVKHYACCKEPYPYLDFEFTFHRKRNTHYHHPRL